MQAAPAIVVALAGLFVGSFLTVVIERVPVDQSLRPPWRCQTCQAPIARRDSLPVASWLILRGRCRACGGSIPVDYPLVEAATGALFLATYAWLGASWDLPAYLYLAAITVSAGVIDFRHHRLPDRITLPSYPIVFALLILGLAGTDGASAMLRALLAGAALFLAYALLLVIYPKGMGGGDVKLAGVLGMLLGWIGWWSVIVGFLASFFIAAAVSIIMLLVRRAGLKSKLPFGPFMFAGTYVGLLYGQQLGQWYWGG